MKVAILNDYQRVALELADWSAVRERVQLDVFHEPIMSEDAVVEQLRDYDVLCLMRERLPFPESLFGRLPKLKCLVTTGAFNLAIDLKAATQHGVVVCGTTNGLGRLATVEHTIALMLGAAKGIAREDRAIRAGRWQTSLPSMLAGKTLGIIGLGEIGAAVARISAALGMRVIAWSSSLTQERASLFNVERTSFEQLLEQSDIVSLHMVLSERTRGMIAHAELARMKPDAILVNTSRGPLVNERDLAAALADGIIGGAALDAFDHEPLAQDHPYRNPGIADKLLLSPHMGYVTSEVYQDFYVETVNSLLAYLDGNPIRLLN